MIVVEVLLGGCYRRPGSDRLAMGLQRRRQLLLLRPGLSWFEQLIAGPWRESLPVAVVLLVVAVVVWLLQ